MNFKGCISCRKCEFIRNHAFCGTDKLTEKQLYNNKGYCSNFEDKTQPKKNIVVVEMRTMWKNDPIYGRFLP